MHWAYKRTLDWFRIFFLLSSTQLFSQWISYNLRPLRPLAPFYGRFCGLEYGNAASWIDLQTIQGFVYWNIWEQRLCSSSIWANNVNNKKPPNILGRFSSCNTMQTLCSFFKTGQTTSKQSLQVNSHSLLTRLTKFWSEVKTTVTYHIFNKSFLLYCNDKKY